MKSIRLRLLWHPQAQFAGYLIAQRLGLGRSRDVDIECLPMDFTSGPMEAVLSGKADLAVASPSHMLESTDPDALCMLLSIQQTSSLVYPARRSAGIAKPADLAGHKVGVWPGREDLELRWMLHRAGISEGDVDYVPVTDSVAAILDGTVDCAQMTTYHEWPHLRAASGKPDDFVAFYAGEFQASLLKDGLIARKDWLAANSVAAQATVDAVLEGWTIAFRDPAQAIRICCEVRPDMPETEHAAQLAEIRRLSLTGASLLQGLGYPDPRHAHAAAAAILETEGRGGTVDPNALIDDRFWRAAPAISRRMDW